MFCERCRLTARTILRRSGNSTRATFSTPFPRWDHGFLTGWARRTSNCRPTSRSCLRKASRNFSSAFLPAIHQGTAIQHLGYSPDKAPIRHLTDSELPREVQRLRIDLIQAMNRRQLDRLETDRQMEGVIESFELAFRMQTETPKLVNFAEESKATLDLYGIGDAKTDEFGRRMFDRPAGLRRPASASCRSRSERWDHHNKIATGLPDRCAVSDKPIAGLLDDLKARGLLDDTLVLWGGEFGRTPHAQNGDGREHNHHGFTMWMAGGGAKAESPTARPTTSATSVSKAGSTSTTCTPRCSTCGPGPRTIDLRYHGRPFRLTDVAGKVIKEIVA